MVNWLRDERNRNLVIFISVLVLVPFRGAVCGGASCMGGGTNPCNYMVAMFHATVCMLEKKFWNKSSLGGMGEGSYVW